MNATGSMVPSPSKGTGDLSSMVLAGSDLKLTAEQISFFREEGYLACGAITSTDEVAQIKNTLERLFELRVGEREGTFVDVVAGEDDFGELTSPQIIGPANYAPSLRKTQCFRNASAIAKQLLGEDARCLFELAILKSPRVGAPTPWHQDEASCDPRFDHEHVGVWIPLQNVTAESGCLHFVPKSHQGEVLEHRPVNGDPTAHSLEYNGTIAEDAEIVCPLPAGGFSLHHPRILHCAGQNVSDTPRLAYVMTFGIPPKRSKVVRDFPWQKERHTAAQVRNRHWLWRGGLLVTIYRKIRRGELTNWQVAWFGIRRSIHALRRGA
jgi:ectoine hydroxylase-related dioxygenase (phytanoyl-CoA dioxygenase family)